MEIVENRTLIENHALFYHFTDFFNFDILPCTALAKFAGGEPLLHEGEGTDRLHYLLEGRAKLFLSHENGCISLIDFLTAPCFIGEIELIGAQAYTNGVTAVTPCTCFAIQIRACRKQLLNDTKFLRHLCLFLSRKAIRNTENYSKNRAYPLEVRLADFILITACNGYYRERHTETAEYLGVTYRHLLYVLADFTKKGILSKTKQGYFIREQNSLQSIASLKSLNIYSPNPGRIEND